MALQKKAFFGEFEVIKALAILGLPFVHFIDESGLLMGYINMGSAASDDFVYGFELLRAFGPSIFMICMGIRIQKNGNAKRMINNGIQFLLIGYLLNFVCFALPQYIYGFMYGTGTGQDNVFITGTQDLFGADIYIFVGWFFIFYGLLKKYFKGITTLHMIYIAIAMLLVNTFVGSNIVLDYSVGTQILGSFVTVNDQSYFPLAAWTIYVVIGMAMRDYLTADNFETYHQRITKLLIAGVGGLCVLSAGLAVYGINAVDLVSSFTLYFTMDVMTAFVLVLLSLGVICIFSKIYYAVKANPLERFLTRVSSVIMSYYIFQWFGVSLVTYYILMLFVDVPGVLSIGASVVIMIAIFVACCLLTSKCGYGFLKFILKITDFTKWFKKKSAKNNKKQLPQQ